MLYNVVILWDHRRTYDPPLTETSLGGAWLYSDKHPSSAGMSKASTTCTDYRQPKTENENNPRNFEGRVWSRTLDCGSCRGPNPQQMKTSSGFWEMILVLLRGGGTNLKKKSRVRIYAALSLLILKLAVKIGVC